LTLPSSQGLDLHNIKLVIQWRYVGSLCTLVQRFGRGGQNLLDEALAIYLVEPKYFDGYAAKIKKQKSMAKPRKRWKQKNDEETEISRVEDAQEDVDGESASITATVYCTESPFLPPWRSLSEAEYEVMAMD
jgi:superfamily II DNA/RNA helicase